MSSWQLLHESDSMKNLLGILRCPYTCAELGKNGPCGPSPSCSMLNGGISGFSIRARLAQRASRVYRNPAPTPARTIRQTATRTTDMPVPEPNHPRRPAASAINNAKAATHTTMCVYIQFHSDREV